MTIFAIASRAFCVPSLFFLDEKRLLEEGSEVVNVIGWARSRFTGDAPAEEAHWSRPILSNDYRVTGPMTIGESKKIYRYFSTEVSHRQVPDVRPKLAPIFIRFFYSVVFVSPVVAGVVRQRTTR